MEYRTVATKLPSNEFTLFKAFCEKKGITPASLMRQLILHELTITIPHTVAGKNEVHYEKTTNSFTWSVELDNGGRVQILSNISPEFIEDLKEIIMFGLTERDAFIQKTKKDSVPVPSEILRGKK